MDVGITGSSGLIGTALQTALRASGHRAVPIVRRVAAPGQISWDPAAGTIDTAALEGIDAVVHLAGAGIGDHRWTDDYKREVLDSRVKGTTTLATALASAATKPAVLVSGSAIGWYGDRGSEELTEASDPGTGFLADVCRRWEESTQAAEAAGIRTVHVRTGIVLSPAGGALRKQLPLFRFGLGGKFGKGDQWQSWISIDDEVGAILHLLGADVRGAVNLTAPNPVTNAEFTKVLGSVLKRPTLLPIPKLGPSLVLGGELAENLLYTGQRVLPARLLESGYRFVHPTLETALRQLLGRAA